MIASAVFAAGIEFAHAIPAVAPQTSAQTGVEKTVVAAKRKPVKKAARKSSRKVAKAKPQPLVIVSKPPNDAPDFDFHARIEEAQALAEKQPTLPGDMTFDSKGNLTRFVWTLVVGQRSGPLTVLRMDEKGFNDAGFNVTWAVDNFINTRFKITRPEGYIVFAQRRPVRSASRPGTYEMGVYTSYAPEMDTKTMRTAGMDYLKLLQRLAYNKIKDHDVRSLVSPNATVADQIPTSMVLRLMIAEHIDPLRMRYVGIEQCIHEVLITIAANRGRAYAYAKSSAGARGISQFIEDSYHMVRDNYPGALLEPNFERGMLDLRNAVLASVLHLDLELTHLPQKTLKTITRSDEHLFDFLAAGYNRNPAKVAKTFTRTKSMTGGNSPAETKMYVRIQGFVGKFLKREFDIT